MKTNYLSSVIKQFEYYKMFGEKAMEQLDDDGLFWQYNEESNSIAIIVSHISGNMQSRFLAAVVFKHHEKGDGTFNVKIRVYHNHGIKYIDTSHFPASAGDALIQMEGTDTVLSVPLPTS